MQNKNYVFIARSLDGFIADKDGGIEYLESVPNTDHLDMDYNNLIEKIDALVMGRATYEKVLSFNIPWPYTKPVFVVSNTLKVVPEELIGKVEISTGTPQEMIQLLEQKGYSKLYIDGGATIQSFLKEDLIDEMILTTIPVLLGGGIPLFGELPKSLMWEHVKSEVYLDAITQDTYRRKR